MLRSGWADSENTSPDVDSSDANAKFAIYNLKKLLREIFHFKIIGQIQLKFFNLVSGPGVNLKNKEIQ